MNHVEDDDGDALSEDLELKDDQEEYVQYKILSKISENRRLDCRMAIAT